MDEGAEALRLRWTYMWPLLFRMRKPIVFDYDGSTVRLGGTLDLPEAREIAKLIEEFTATRPPFRSP